MYFLLTIVILNIVYTIGFLGIKIIMNVRHSHYFLGYNPGMVTFPVGKVKITLGLYLPIIGLSRIYRIENGEKKPIHYPWQFTGVSIAKRLLVTYSGVLTMLVFALAASVVATYRADEKYIPKEEVNKYGVYPSDEARVIGFLPGDKILKVNGHDYEDFTELVHPDVIHSPETYYTVLRADKELTISLKDLRAPKLARQGLLFELNAPFSVGTVQPGSPADEAEIRPGDRILRVNGNPVASRGDMNHMVQADEDGVVLLEIARGEGTADRFERTIPLNDARRLGIFVNQEIQYKRKQYSFIQSIGLGSLRLWRTMVLQVNTFKRIVSFSSPASERPVNAPIRISPALGHESEIDVFISLMFMCSASAILLNLLPFPKSAFLEVVPLGYEAVTGKPFGYKSFRVLQTISICLLIGFLVLEFVSDLLRMSLY